MREREIIPHLQVGFRFRVSGMWSGQLQQVITCYCARISWLLICFSTLTMFLKLKLIILYTNKRLNIYVYILPEHPNIMYIFHDTVRNSRENLRFELFVYFSQIELLPMYAKAKRKTLKKRRKKKSYKFGCTHPYPCIFFKFLG